MPDLLWSLLALIPVLSAAGMGAVRLRHRHDSTSFAAFLDTEERDDA